MRGFAWILFAASGCGFSVGGSAAVGDETSRPDAGTGTTIDAPIGPEVDAAPPAPLRLFAASGSSLYAIDVDAKQATLVGPVAPSGGSPISVDGLALHGSVLLGITPGGAKLVTIDPASGTITDQKALTPSGAYGGLTVIPAGDLGPSAVVLAGRRDDDRLFRIDPATGTVTSLGYFGDDMVFSSDLAWVKGAGLFATLEGGWCEDVCFAWIDPANGAAAVFRDDLSANLFGLSGYRDQLWAFNSAGPVLSVNKTNGLLSMVFDPQIAWTEAAQ